MVSTGPPKLGSKHDQSFDSATQLSDTHAEHSQHTRNLDGLISNARNSAAFHRQRSTNAALFSLLCFWVFFNGLVSTIPTG